jgi:hypothetical protein
LLWPFTSILIACALRAAFENRGWLLRKTPLFKPEILGQSRAHHAG